MYGGDSNLQQQQQLYQQQLAAMQQYHQHWMAIQYPAMVMQQRMMYNVHHMPYYHGHHMQQQLLPVKNNHQIQISGDDNKTIWIGDLQQWMDEDYLQSCFSQTGEVVSVKTIRNKQTGQTVRYGFIEFNSHAAAEKVLQSYNGTMMPNTEQPFRLNWAGFSAGDRRPEAGSDLSIFVGDLAADVTDEMLNDIFASRYPSVKGAKLVVDSSTGRPKGYGFVRFGDENDRSQALTEMNGVCCSSKPMRVGVATPKKPSIQQQYTSQDVVFSGGYTPNGAVPQYQSDSDSPNTTIFVGGLDSDVTDEELRQFFTPFGDILSVKIPAGKGCGFVQFSNRLDAVRYLLNTSTVRWFIHHGLWLRSTGLLTMRSDAEEAIQRLSGTVIGKQTVRLSWGRNLANKQMRMNFNNGAYYGKQVNSGGEHTKSTAYGAPSNGHANPQHQELIL